MKVALVHDLLVKLGGGESTLRVLADIFPDAPIHTLVYDEEKVGKIFPKSRVKTSVLHKYPDIIRSKYQLLLTKMPKAIERFDFTDYDVVISSSSAFAHGIITPVNTTHICYCHSPMRYVWDYKNEYLKEQNLGSVSHFLASKVLKKIRLWDQVAADRPDIYIANSKHVQKRIKKYYKKDSEVIYPPVETSRFKPKKKNDDYFLIVSTLSPYKKVDLAVQLFNKIGKPLKIIGEGSQKKFLQSLAADNIEILGYKSDKEVEKYIQNCKALIFPGEEDFGITPIEAMACGKPVLAYGKGGALESVVKGKTGEFFYKPTISSIEDGLANLLINENKFKPQTIRKLAEKFDRKVFEREIKKIVNKCK